jgi:hypothetical protein
MYFSPEMKRRSGNRSVYGETDHITADDSGPLEHNMKIRTIKRMLNLRNNGFQHKEVDAELKLPIGTSYKTFQNRKVRKLLQKM